MSEEKKGTAENPYTLEEYERLIEERNWKGGYVRGDNGNPYYAMPQVIVTSYSGYDNDGSDSLGSDDYDNYGSDTYDYGSDTDSTENSWPSGDNTGNGHTGGGAGSSNIGGGSNSGSSNNGSGSSANNSGSSNIPSGPSSQTLNSATTKLIIAKGANYLSNYTKNLLLNLEGYSGTIKITNTSRTPEKQAQIMYDAILRTGKEYQYETYRAPGKRVIDVYDPNKSREENIINMTKQIYKEGPINVSRHCADFNELNTFDISRTYSTNLNALYSSLKKLLEKGLLRNLLNETENSCIHVEIWQK